MNASDFTRVALNEKTKELQAAQADAALYERLKKAAATATRLLSETRELTNALSKQLDEEEAERRAALAGRVRNIRFIVSYPNQCEGNLTRARITLVCERMTWDYRFSISAWADEAHDDLRYLPGDVEELLMQNLDKLPSAIHALAPADPADALERYRIGLTRGYFTAA